MSGLVAAWRQIADSKLGRPQITMSRSTLRKLLDECETDRAIADRVRACMNDAPPTALDDELGLLEYLETGVVR